ESRANNVIYVGRASFRMEPAPLGSHDLDGTPAPQVDLTDTDDGSGRAAVIDAPGLRPGLDVPFTSATRADEGEAPYLRKRIPTDAGGIATPTPMGDLTDPAVAPGVVAASSGGAGRAGVLRWFVDRDDRGRAGTPRAHGVRGAQRAGGR